MKVLIVGAGGQGGACASILARQDAVKEIRLADLKESAAREVAEQIKSKKIVTDVVNATDSEDVARAAAGVDVMIDIVIMNDIVTAVLDKLAVMRHSNYSSSFFL